MNMANFISVAKSCVAPVSAQANLRKQVKRSGRSQNPSLQKGLPA